MTTSPTVEIGIGLPIADPQILTDWATRADQGPFSTLGMLDRLVYDNPEPLVTLAHLERVARWQGGLLAAAAPSWAGPLFDTVRGYWKEYGRPGYPRIVAQVNAALGSRAVLDDARSAMSAYYAFSEYGANMVDGMLTTAAQIRAVTRQFADLGADEVIFYCYGRDPEQVDRLADIVG